jgi:hypothetical protein
MAKSSKQLQDELVNDGTLDRLAESNKDFAALVELPVTKQLIILSAANFILRVQENIKRLGKVSTGRLEDGITQGDLIEDNFGYEVDLGYEANGPGAKYYDYVNKGVKGKSGGPDSPYAFKSLNPSRKMVSAIEMWMVQNNVRSRNEDQTRNRSALQTKRASVRSMASAQSNQRSLAYVIARSIKRRGLEKTAFFDEAIDFSFGKGFIDAVSKTVGTDIKVYIRQANLLINEKNNR